jgi:ribosomal protein S18 acetylase RimI-like enzyme
VCALSNPPPAGDGPHSPAPTFSIRKAVHPDIHPAVSAILGFWQHPGGRSAVDEFIRSAPDRGIDLTNLWVAEQAGHIAYAALPVLSPGRTMLLFLPARIPTPLVASALLHALCVHYANRDVHLAQLLLESGTAALRQFLLDHAFLHMADLIYLQTTPPPGIAPPPLPPGCQLATYSPQNHDQFARAILRSYEGSLDCPGLNGMRTIEDTITGHKATGQFDPSTWFLLTETVAPHPALAKPTPPSHLAAASAPPPEPLGVLLLSHVARTDALELVYLGLTPQARGRGFGQRLMRLALATTLRANLRRLTLAVDAKNAPALKLYYANGMQRLTARAAFLRDLKPLRTIP